MYGWRARIGLLVPSDNCVIEPELYSVAPPGVAMHSTRLLLDAISDDAVQRMEAQAPRGLTELSATGVDVAVYACMGTSFCKEEGWGGNFKANAERSTGIPCSTASLSMLAAFEDLGVTRLAVGTPYKPFQNDRIGAFLADHGYELVSLRGLELEINQGGRQPPNVAYELARSVDAPDADAICLFSTDFRTLDVIQALEDDLGKPVISTNQAILWHALALAGVSVPIPNYGRLLAAR
jgi:maleate isomerase